MRGIDAEQALPPRYVPIRVLGRGGQGIVYEVRDAARGGERLALKLVADASADLAASLEHEFRVLSRIAHPGIARVIDFGRLLADRGVFFTSELVEGVDLFEFFANDLGASRWRLASHVAARTLGALHVLHQAGWAHGDVKPANVLVCRGERADARDDIAVKVLDLGAAVLRRPGVRSDGGWVTGIYRPLESMRNEPVQGDLFALGLALFHAFVGRLPFDLDDEHAGASWRAAARPARLSDWVDGVPDALDRLVARLTAFEREKRFENALDALTSVGHARPLPLRAETLRPRTGRLYGRSRDLEELARLLDADTSDDAVSGGAPIVLVAAPRGSGKRRLAQGVATQLHLDGCHCVSVLPGGEGRALGELVEIAREIDPAFEQGGDPDALPYRLLEAISGERLVISLIEWAPGTSDENNARRVLEELVRIHASRKVPRRLRVLVTTESPSGFWSTFDLPRARVHGHALAPLDAIAVGDLLRDAFATHRVPEDLIESVARWTGGRPSEIWGRVTQLVESGVEVDASGELRFARAWREVLREAPRWRDPVSENDPRSREALDALARLRGLAISSAEAQAWFGNESSRELDSQDAWQRAFDDLYWSGQVVVRRDADASRYRARRLDSPSSSAPVSSMPRRVLERFDGSPLEPCFRGADAALALARLASDTDSTDAVAGLSLRAARLLRHSNRFDEAIDVLLDADRALAARGEASRRRALVSIRAAALSRLAGRADAATDALGWIIDGSTMPDSLRARALWLSAALLEQRGELERAVARLAELETLLERGLSGERARVETLLRLAEIAFARGDGSTARSHALAALERLEHGEKPTGEPRQRLLTRAGRLFTTLGDLDRALDLLARARELARDLGREELEEGALEGVATIHGRAGRFEDSEAAFETCETFAARRNDRLALLRLRFNRAALHYRVGRVDSALALFESAADQSRSVGPNRYADSIALGLEAVARERGKFMQAIRVLRPLCSGRRTDRQRRASALFNLGEIMLALGRPSRAIELRGRALDDFARSGDRANVAMAWIGLAFALSAIGDVTSAREALEAADARIDEHDAASRASRDCVDARLALLDAGTMDSGTLKSLESCLERALELRVAPAAELAALGVAEAALALDESARGLRALERCAGALGWSTGGRRGRYPFLRLALAAALSDVDRVRSTERLAREAAEAGRVWEALYVRLRVSPRIERADARRPIDARTYELMGRFVHGLDAAARAGFAAAFLPAGSRRPEKGPVDRSDVSAASSAPDTSDELASIRALAARWTCLSEASLRDDDELAEELEQARLALGATGLWIVNPPDLKETPVRAARSCSDQPVAVLFEERSALNAVRRGEDTRTGDGWCLVALPGGRPERRVLHATFSSRPPDRRVGEAAVPLSRARVVATLVAQLLRARALAIALDTERSRAARHADELRRLHGKAARQKSQFETASISRHVRDGRSAIIAKSPTMRALVEQIERVAESSVPVLVFGEHGSGKTLVARVIHALSPRADRPFLSEVCDVPESLLESELFGHVRGAFTGADADRSGLLETSSGGSLYLDRVDEMPPGIQAKLVRVLDDGVVRPLGTESTRHVDVRLIASTCLSPAELDASGVREDFRFRIQGVALRVPPLRERREDLRELFDSLLAIHADELGVPVPRVDRDVSEALEEARWPGNVRQLENLARGLLLEQSARITGSRVAAALSSSSSAARKTPVGHATRTHPTLQEAREACEARLLEEVLASCQGNATEAARVLGISRRHLGTMLAKYGLDPLAFRPRKGC